jgi:hypothetical protein
MGELGHLHPERTRTQMFVCLSVINLTDALCESISLQQLVIFSLHSRGIFLFLDK